MQEKSSRFLLCFLFGALLLTFFSACRKENSKLKTLTLYKPVYRAKNEVLSAINGNSAQPIDSAGKIYIKGNFIFLNEVDKGIHIIDNSNRSHPVQTAFLNIPGNQDIAVKGNTLYADMYGDLLAIDISNPLHTVITGRLQNLFKNRLYVNGFYQDSSQVIVDWIKKDTMVNTETYYNPYPDCANCSFFKASAAAGGANSGVAGSMARMVMIGDYLYAITESHSVGIVNAGNAATPELVSEMFAGFDLETIYPFENKLFLGSSIGMFMYDVSDPSNPVTLGRFSHGRACDPVVTDGQYAYVTLHAGSQCGGEANELQVINVENLLEPQLVKTYPMTMPGGLSKDGNNLFVCDGSSGVKIYNAKHPADLKLLKSIQIKEPYDIIAANHTALIVAKDGLYQYDYSDNGSIRLLSYFAMGK